MTHERARENYKRNVLTVARGHQAQQDEPDEHFGERGGRHLRHRIYHRAPLKEDRNAVFRTSDRARVLLPKRMVRVRFVPARR